MPKVGGRRRKTRTHKEIEIEEETDLLGRIPKAFIFKRGKVPNTIKTLVNDYREIMYPYTSMNLKENDKTSMKEYIKAAGYYQMSHMVIFTATKKSAYLRFIKTPTGPTITFKIIGYSNRNEVLNIQRKFKSFSRQFSPALLVMNGFNLKEEDIVQLRDNQNTPSSQHMKLVASMVQSMFPPINVQKTKPENQKRVLLFSYNSKRDSIYLRHYQILFSLKGIDKKMKKIIKANKLPNLDKYQNFSDFLGKNHQMFQSDTEASDIEGAEVDLEKPYAGDRSKKVKSQMSVRLHEVGPRLQLRLYKIEEAILGGNVLYHRIVRKSGTAIEKQRKLIRKRWAIKERRKQEQQQRIDEKQQAKQKNKKSYVDEENLEEQEIEQPLKQKKNRRHEFQQDLNDEFNAYDEQLQQPVKKIKK